MSSTKRAHCGRGVAGALRGRCGGVASRCSAVRCGAVRCGAVRCGAVLCGAVCGACLPAREVGLEARPEVVDGGAARTEARHGAARPLEAELRQHEQLVRVLARGKEALDDEVAEAREGGGARTTHEVDVLGGELEGRRLEVHVTARAARKKEAEVDVHHMPHGVQHDVPVVPVLDLQQVACDCPRGHTAAEVERGAPVVTRGRWAVQQHEELGEGGALWSSRARVRVRVRVSRSAQAWARVGIRTALTGVLPLEGVERDRVGDRLDEAALGPGGHLVRVRSGSGLGSGLGLGL